MDTLSISTQQRRAAARVPLEVPNGPLGRLERASTLRDHLGDDAFVELTMMVAVENQRPASTARWA